MATFITPFDRADIQSLIRGPNVIRFSAPLNRMCLISKVSTGAIGTKADIATKVIRSAADLKRTSKSSTEGPTYPVSRGGRRRSWNHVRYSCIFARWAEEACRLHVEASSLPSGAPHLSSTQSFGLYANSRSVARSSTSLSASVHVEPSLRV